MENEKIVQETASREDEKIVRQMIRHEDNLTNHRISWLNTIQGLLFAALGFAWDKEVYLVYLLCWLGVVVAITSGVALHCSREAGERLYKGFRRNKQELWYPDVVGYWDESWYIRYGSPWLVLPILFLITWVGIFIFILL